MFVCKNVCDYVKMFVIIVPRMRMVPPFKIQY